MPLTKELDRLAVCLTEKSEEFDDVLKMGRTQLQDAVPMRLGQTFHSYSSMVRRDVERICSISHEMYTLNLGGTAIGSAINVSEIYLHNIVPKLKKVTGYPLKQADDLFDATENLDGFVAISWCRKDLCHRSLQKCNDLRLLSSRSKNRTWRHQPSCTSEWLLHHAWQKSIPVIPEVVTQVAFHIVGHDTTINNGC